MARSMAAAYASFSVVVALLIASSLASSTVYVQWVTSDCSGVPIYWQLLPLNTSITPSSTCTSSIDKMNCLPFSNISTVQITGSAKLGCLDGVNLSETANLFPNLDYTVNPFVFEDDYLDAACSSKAQSVRYGIIANGQCIPQYQTNVDDQIVGVELYRSVSCGRQQVCTDSVCTNCTTETLTINTCNGGFRYTCSGTSGAPPPPASSSSSSLPIIVGCVVGGVVLVVGIIVILWIRRRRNQKSESQQNLVAGVPPNQQMQQPFAPQMDGMYMSQLNVPQQNGVQQNAAMAYATPSGKSALQVQSPNSSKTLTVPSANLSKDQLDNIWKGAQGRVIQQFIPQNSDELVLNFGDIVVVGEAFPDGWATGMNLMINSSGLFPLVCIAREGSQSFSSPSQQMRSIPPRSIAFSQAQSLSFPGQSQMFPQSVRDVAGPPQSFNGVGATPR